MPAKKKQSRFGSGKKKLNSAPQVRIPDFWSVSRWSVYNKCPKQYHGKYVIKSELFKADDNNPHLIRGNTAHKKGEYYLLGEVRGVPKEFQLFKEELRELKNAGAKPEEGWATDRNWKPCAGDDWKRAWVRSKSDAHLFIPEDKLLIAVDYKTGKQRDSHEEEAEVYAVVGASQYPQALTIETEYWYLDSGEPMVQEFTRNNIMALRKKWKARAEKMLKDRKWKATPSDDACRYCPLRSDKGGTCDAWKKA